MVLLGRGLSLRHVCEDGKVIGVAVVVLDIPSFGPRKGVEQVLAFRPQPLLLSEVNVHDD
jgi:hypothetical protein